MKLRGSNKYFSTLFKNTRRVYLSVTHASL